MFKDLAAKKKKKAKKPKVVDFDAKLAEVDQSAPQDAEPTKAASTSEDMSYEQLLSRFYEQLHLSQPDRGSANPKNLKIPPPQCLREGNKKTIFANLSEIAERLKRTEEHITQFLFAEMGTTGSVDGSRRLVIKGRFQAKQIERWVSLASDSRVYTDNTERASPIYPRLRLM
jgi:translation initiation factor 2 subunit 2